MTALSSSLISDGTLITKQYDEFLSTTQYSPFPATANSGSIAFTSNTGSPTPSVTTNNSSITYGANTDWNFLHNGTQDFTIECWINTTNNITYQSICGTAVGTNQVGMEFALSANNIVDPLLFGELSLWFYRGQAGINAGPGTASYKIAANTWNHVAVTFKSSDKTVAFYVNGISTPVANNRGSNTLTSFAYSSANSAYPFGVGTATADSDVYWNFDGYITGFKIAKSILYTSSFQLPNLLPVADSNTVLLLNTANSNNYLLDSSANSYTANTFKPTRFSTEAPYLRGNIEGSGSIQFTAASTKGNLLYYGANTDWNFLHNGTEDYTVECWFNNNTTSADFATIMCTSSYLANQTGFHIGINDIGNFGLGSGHISVFYNNGIDTSWMVTERPGMYTAIPVFKANTWNHLAYTFESRKKLGRIYLNGNSMNTTTPIGYTNLQSFAYSSNNSFVPLSFGGVKVPFSQIGYAAFYNGKLSNVRVVRGKIVYPFDFILDPKPLTIVPNTVFLLKTSNNITYTLDATGNYTANNQGANTKIYTNPVFSYDTPIANPDSGVSSDIRQRLYSNGSLQLLTLDEVSLSDLVIANTTPYTDSGSIFFNGANSFISYGANTDWTFLNSGTTDWTIETFIYPTAPAPAGNSVTIFNTGAGITGYRGISLEMYGTNAPNTSGLEIVQNDLIFKLIEPSYIANNNTFASGTNSTVRGAGLVYGIRKPGIGLTTNTWTHLVVTFKADERTFNLYLDGELKFTVGVTYGQLGITIWEYATPTYANSAPTNALTIGATLLTDIPTVNFSGYISNFRVTKSLLYTTRKILVPNKILPVQNNTVLLLNTANSSNYIVDSSANNYGSTSLYTSFSNNTPFISLPDTTGIPRERLNPDGTLQIFKEFDEVTPLTNSGSIEFRGGNVTSYFATQLTTGFVPFASNNFSIEFWFYWNGPTSTGDKTVGLLNSAYAGVYGWSILAKNGFINFIAGSTLLANSGTSGYGSFAGNTWNHVAVVRSYQIEGGGRQLSLFLNGQKMAANNSATALGNIYNSNLTGGIQFGHLGYVGNYTGNTFNGFISNVRVVDSITTTAPMPYNAHAGYIDVPTSPLSPILTSNTVTRLLLNTENFNNFLTDNGTYGYLISSETLLFSDKTPFPGTT
jgi:hypothetical protein